MRTGHVDGAGTVYNENGEPILGKGERIIRSVANDRIDVSEGLSYEAYSNSVYILNGAGNTSCYDLVGTSGSLWEFDNNHCYRTGTGTT